MWKLRDILSKSIWVFMAVILSVIDGRILQKDPLVPKPTDPKSPQKDPSPISLFTVLQGHARMVVWGGRDGKYEQRRLRGMKKEKITKKTRPNALKRLFLGY